MKTTIYIDAYDDDGSQKSFVYKGPIQNLRPQVFFDQVFLILETKSASLIAVSKITHIKVEND